MATQSHEPPSIQAFPVSPTVSHRYTARGGPRPRQCQRGFVYICLCWVWNANKSELDFLLGGSRSLYLVCPVLAFSCVFLDATLYIKWARVLIAGFLVESQLSHLDLASYSQLLTALLLPVVGPWYVVFLRYTDTCS